MTLSLQARLLLTASVILAAFVALTGLALERAFRHSAKAALTDRLEGTMFALLAATEVSEDGTLSFSRALPDPRLNQPGSGLYARIERTDGSQRLTTPSLLGVDIEMPPVPAVGERRFQRLRSGDGTPLYGYSYTVNWDYGPQHQYPVAYFLAEDLRGYRRQIAHYRRRLWGWLGVAALLLLLAQTLVLRWGLKPLRQVAHELLEIEAGRKNRLQGRYPPELSGLTRNLNTLLATNQERLTRYRDAVGNVSHSLKTPLTVLRGVLSGGDSDQRSRQVAVEQLNRMQQIIDYHLKRASAAGGRPVQPVAVAPVVTKVVDALKKSHADRPVQVEPSIDPAARFDGDEGDLYEIVGNLLENAFKWGRRRIRLTARHHSDQGFLLRIEDDGPGIPASIAAGMLERGKRADPAMEGHGLGLAMVHETVLLYGGAVTIGRSDLGGAVIDITIP